MRLAGRIGLVTGAQQGIGRAIAVALAREGADVAVNFLDDRGAAERVAGEVTALGRRTVVVPGDVSRRAEVEAMVQTTVKALGTPDIVINNAGVFPRVAFLDMQDADWDLVLGVNLKGSFLCAQAGARAMVAAGRKGAIVNIASSAVRGDPRGVHYSSSKASASTRSPPAPPTPRSRVTATPRSSSPPAPARSRWAAAWGPPTRSRGWWRSWPPTTQAG
jgi:NAD(P)-dependent dehydrogenase (short-subunit alcohol dehydrogenase family)